MEKRIVRSIDDLTAAETVELEMMKVSNRGTRVEDLISNIVGATGGLVCLKKKVPDEQKTVNPEQKTV